jgi:hypothetical protein
MAKTKHNRGPIVAAGTRNSRSELQHRSPERLRLEDRVAEDLAQADALAEILCGEGGEAFRLHNHDIQDRVLWLLSRLISEARTGFEALAVADDAPRG